MLYGADRKFAGRLAGGYQNPLFRLQSYVFQPGAWHHLAMVKDNTAKKLYFYVDGQPAPGSPADFTGDPVSIYVEALPEGTSHKEYYTKFRIGALSPYFDDTSNYTNGCIDDVRMYNRALTAEEIRVIAGDAYNEPPVAVISAEPTSGIEPLTVGFDGSNSWDNVGNIVSYEWSLGDGNTSSEVTFDYTYATSGTYTAVLTVTDDRGATDSDSVMISVSPPPPEMYIDKWSSVALHGRGIGLAKLEIPDDGNFVEPRGSGIYLLLLDFSEAIDPASLIAENVEIAGLDANNAPVDLGGINISTGTMGDLVGMIFLDSPLPDCAKYVVQVSGVEGLWTGAQLAGDTDRIMTGLCGDVSGDLQVDAADLSQVRAARTGLIDAQNPGQVRADNTLDGRVNSSDLSRVRTRRGNDARGIADPVIGP